MSIVQTLYPTVQKNMSNQMTQRKILQHIARYCDLNSEILHDIGMAKSLYFMDKDKEMIYESIGLDSKEIKKCIKESKHIGSTWQIMNEPLNTAFALAIRYAVMNNKPYKEKSKETTFENSLVVFYSFYFYSSLCHKYLKHGANEDIMAYTINNLSNKFRIKVVGSLYKTLESISLKSHETYRENLINGDDTDLITYVSALKSRLNEIVKKVTDEYMRNHANQNFLNTDFDDNSEENYHESNSISFDIKRYTDSTMERLSHSGANSQLIGLAAETGDTSKNEIRNVVFTLCDENLQDIERLLQLILTLFLQEHGNRIEDIMTQKFLSSCLEIYSKSNTTDQLVIEIKDILHKWLMKFSTVYKRTKRQSNLRKGLFVYFVLQIQYSAK